MDQPIVTVRLQLSSSLREPGEAEVQAAGALLEQLQAEAQALGRQPSAAAVHSAMGRIWIERLGDPRSAAVCYQNAFELDPAYRPNLEAARRLFAGEGAWERALALHQREERLLKEPAARAESLRAQARLLERELHRPAEAAALVQQALALAPDHPALLKAAVEAAEASGDLALTARLLLRSAAALKDEVQRAVLLRRAVLILEQLQAALARAPASADGAPAAPPDPLAPPVAPPGPGEGGEAPTAAGLEQDLSEAVQRLHSAAPADPIGLFALARRARDAAAWDELASVCRSQADRTGTTADRLLCAQLAAHKLSRAVEALRDVRAGLLEAPGDAGLLALQAELAAASAPQDLPAALAARAESAADPSEKADLRVVAASYAQGPLEREQLFSEALAENPGDGAAIALHARLVAERDAEAAAERFVSLAEALEGHAADEAASHLAEAGLWRERAGQREPAAALARRALALHPGFPPALRLLTRTLPFLGAQAELARLLEGAADSAKRWQGAELLARAAALLSDLPTPPDQEPVAAGDGASGVVVAAGLIEVPPRQRALDLSQRAAERARGLTGPRWQEPWTLLALRAGDLGAFGRSLEARADAGSSTEAAELLVEAAELARAGGDDARAAVLLRKARAADPGAARARQALLFLPALPVGERLELLAEEARGAEPARAAALHAERAALLEAEGQLDEAVAACALSLSVGGADLAVLRRLSRLQLRRGDAKAAIEVLVQIAQTAPEGAAQSDAFCRAAELAEWRLLDLSRAEELYGQAAQALPGAAGAWAARARICGWLGRWADAAAAAEQLAAAAVPASSSSPSAAARAQRREALRLAATLRAFRTGEQARGATLFARLLADEPGDLDAMAAVLALGRADFSTEGRKERIELRGKLASRCQDGRLAALLRAESAEDRLAAGERDQGVAEYRRALALNPHDRVALDLVEEALRGSQQRQLLADHLAFRCAYEDGATRAALSLQQAELFAEDGQLEKAANAYRQSLNHDGDSLLAVRGARKIAEAMGDKAEVMRLLTREAALTQDPTLAAGSLIEAALLAEGMGDKEEALTHLTSVLERHPGNQEVVERLRRLHGEEAPRELAALYERIGTAQTDGAAGAVAWSKAARVQLDELGDPQAAFIAAGRALSRAPEDLEALTLRTDAAMAAGRWAEAAEALATRHRLTSDRAAAAGLRLRLGTLYLEKLDDGERALPLLLEQLAEVEPGALLKLSPFARKLPAAEATRFYRRMLEAFPAPTPGGSPTQAQIALWADELGRGLLAQGERAEALLAFRRAFALEPSNRQALQHVAELSAAEAPAEAIAVYRQLFGLQGGSAEPLHALVPLFMRTQQDEGALCAAAALVGLGQASAPEKALYEPFAQKPPGAEIPQLAELPALRGAGDEGPARELLAAAASDLARALPADLTGRADRVKGDNPVRRICAALARALGLAEPALYLSKPEPAVVAAVNADPAGLMVGLEAPRRYPPRQQRFLYARGLAWLRCGLHPLAGWSGPRLGGLVAALVRLCAPAGTDASKLPAPDPALLEALDRKLPLEARARLAAAAARAAAEPADFDALALGLRETVERTALVLCGDPAAGLSLVAQECPGSLDRPELQRLARFAVSEPFLALRAR